MEIDQVLMRGADVEAGKGLHQRKLEKRSQSRDVSEKVISVALKSSLANAAKECGVSEVAASKILARELKKNNSLSADLLIDPTVIKEIESLILKCNTTSVAKVLLASQGKFSEAEIRIVKAQIEKNGVGNWDS